MNNHTPCEAQTEVDRLVRLLLEATELLKKGEWHEFDATNKYCWYCGCLEKNGHADDCRLAIYFKRVEGE